MPADFKPTRNKDTFTDSNFKRSEFWAMFGATGAPAAGAATKKSGWVSVANCAWKGLFLRAFDQKNGLSTGAVQA